MRLWVNGWHLCTRAWGLSEADRRGDDAPFLGEDVLVTR